MYIRKPSQSILLKSMFFPGGGGGGGSLSSKIQSSAIQIVKVPPINAENFLKSMPINP